jgi:hypothetical protein
MSRDWVATGLATSAERVPVGFEGAAHRVGAPTGTRADAASVRIPSNACPDSVRLPALRPLPLALLDNSYPHPASPAMWSSGMPCCGGSTSPARRPPLFPRPSPALVLVLLAALPLVIAGTAAMAGDENDFPYPRLGLYGSIRGWGYPLIDSSRAGPLDMDAIRTVARYHEVSFDASPITDFRPDVIAALRQENPDIVVLAYVVGHRIWNAHDQDSLVHFPTRYRQLVDDLDGWLYNRQGNHFSETNVNLAMRDASGNYVMADSLAALMYDAVLRRNIWDGLFIDIICDKILWMNTPAESIDFVRAGYPNAAEFDYHWQQGSTRLSTRLRELGGPEAVLVGNCSLGTKYSIYNGWMREDFPFQSLNTWDSNMFRVPGGYFVDEANFREPRHNYIFSSLIGTDPYDATNMRRARFGIGSASLGDGFGVFGNKERDAALAPFHEWWYDEYAVDVLSGQASTERRHTGWLGYPKGGWYQQMWLNGNPDVVTNPNFESGVTSGWAMVNFVPATLAWDQQTAALGSASARVDVPTAAPTDYWVQLNTVGTLNAVDKQTHTATFWAKASAPRTIKVAMSKTGGGFLAAQTVALTTTWSRYSIALLPNGTGASKLQFYVGDVAGSVWFDDVHFQSGPASVYRREFDRGSVLVNPFTQSVQVALGESMRRIQGIRDPVTNNGAVSDSATVGPSDALFLLKTVLPVGIGPTAEISGPGVLLESPAPTPGRVNTYTTFAFTLATEDRVELEVFDAAGRRLARREAQRFAPGRSTVRWNPGTQRAGLYFVVARTGQGTSVSRKWVVLE